MTAPTAALSLVVMLSNMQASLAQSVRMNVNQLATSSRSIQGDTVLQLANDFMVSLEARNLVEIENTSPRATR